MFCVYVMPTGVYHGIHAVKALVLEEFDRAAPDGTGSAKVGGNYAPVLKWSDKARKEGYGITLHLDSKTRSEIDEFSTSGFIGVKGTGDDITLVTPDSKCVIASVTSDSCLDIARSLGWKTETRSVSVYRAMFILQACANGILGDIARAITSESQQGMCKLGPDHSRNLKTKYLLPQLLANR